jgi:hypothetical protein
VQFHSRNAIGKAGERLVETFVEETLNFVYRKMSGPDIGIDGEIEILASNRSSTGGLLKVQVKTSEGPLGHKRLRLPFDENHLDYFNSLTVPSILAVVGLTDRRILWKPILPKETYRGPRGGFGVFVDPHADEMTPFSALDLRMIGERSNEQLQNI